MLRTQRGTWTIPACSGLLVGILSSFLEVCCLPLHVVAHQNHDLLVALRLFSKYSSQTISSRLRWQSCAVMYEMKEPATCPEKVRSVPGVTMLTTAAPSIMMTFTFLGIWFCGIVSAWPSTPTSSLEDLNFLDRIKMADSPGSRAWKIHQDHHFWCDKKCRVWRRENTLSSLMIAVG